MPKGGILRPGRGGSFAKEQCREHVGLSRRDLFPIDEKQLQPLVLQISRDPAEVTQLWKCIGVLMRQQQAGFCRRAYMIIASSLRITQRVSSEIGIAPQKGIQTRTPF